LPLYSRKITVSPSDEKIEEIEIEGHAITHVTVRFPPGPSGLLAVSFYYGVKQIFPEEENTDIRGDDEIVDWEEYWVLPESPCVVKVKCVNEDVKYEHSCFIRIEVKKKYQLLAEQIINSLLKGLKRLFGWV